MITQAGVHPRVVGLVYVAARAPDAGEDLDAISRTDRTTSPDLQRFLAKRMGATSVEIESGHLSLITHPEQITTMILEAARSAHPAAHAPDTMAAPG